MLFVWYFCEAKFDGIFFRGLVAGKSKFVIIHLQADILYNSLWLSDIVILIPLFCMLGLRVNISKSVLGSP